jgi:hypothetical protein
MKAILLYLFTILLFFACKSKSQVDAEQLAKEQGNTIETLQTERNNLDAEMKGMVDKLRQLAIDEEYLRVTGLNDPVNLDKALDIIDASIDASIQQIQFYKNNEKSTANALNSKLIELESKLKEREDELTAYRAKELTRTDGRPTPPPMKIDLDLYIASLEAKLANTEMKLGAAQKKNTVVVRENTTLKADIAGLESERAALANAIAKAEKELARLENQKEEVIRKFEKEKTELYAKLEKEKAMIYVNIARSMAKDVENVKKSKGRRDEYCQKVVFFYEKVLECNCEVATKVKTEYENFKKNCG